MTRFGIEALAADVATKVIVVVSKPPAAAVAEQVLAALAAAGKPAVVHFVGDAPRASAGAGGLRRLPGRCGAARLPSGRACAGVPGRASAAGGREGRRAGGEATAGRRAQGALLRRHHRAGGAGPAGRAGLGGALEPAQVGRRCAWTGVDPVAGDVLLDLGDDVFTRGRPHPMIEPALRNERLAVEMADPAAALLLFDCVIGYGSHPDPAGGAGGGGGGGAAGCASVVAIASVTGTPDDPQDFRAQVRALEAAGIVVEPDNHAAASLAAAVRKRVR